MNPTMLKRKTSIFYETLHLLRRKSTILRNYRYWKLHEEEPMTGFNLFI